MPCIFNHHYVTAPYVWEYIDVEPFVVLNLKLERLVPYEHQYSPIVLSVFVEAVKLFLLIFNWIEIYLPCRYLLNLSVQTHDEGWCECTVSRQLFNNVVRGLSVSHALNVQSKCFLNLYSIKRS